MSVYSMRLYIRYSWPDTDDEQDRHAILSACTLAYEDTQVI